jgi:integrase/recombinase XerD
MDWQTGIHDFLTYLEKERRASTNTVAAYRNDLNQFADYLQKNLPSSANWRDVQPESINHYSETLAAHGYTSSTVARKVAALKTLLNWLKQTGLVRDDLTTKLKSPRVQKRAPHILSEAEVQNLFEATTRMPAPRSLRDRALLELIYATGMRVTEAIGLRLSDLDLNMALASTEGRGTRQRTAPLTSQAVNALRHYIETARADMLGSAGSDYVFLNPLGTKLTRQAVWQMTRQYARLANIKGEITPHTLRHSRAAHMLSSGTDVRRVQEWLGHANLATTQAYQAREDVIAANMTEVLESK